MSSAVLAALITAILSGLFLLLQKFIEKRYNRAAEAVERNSAAVDDMTDVVQGFKDLNEDYRKKLKEKDEYIRELENKLKNKESGVDSA